jgi:hypothetical protein
MKGEIIIELEWKKENVSSRETVSLSKPLKTANTHILLITLAQLAGRLALALLLTGKMVKPVIHLVVTRR